MACARLSCGTCEYAIVAGRRRPVGGGDGRYAAGVDPADGLDRWQPGASQSGAANRGARRSTRRLWVTRHPMMWAFALWGICHIAVYPMAANIIVAAAIIILALVGAALQDRKKEALQPDTWPDWVKRTSYWPFAAIVSGKARLGGFGMHALAEVSFYGSPQPGRTFRSPAGRRAFGAGCSGALRHMPTSARCA